MENFSLRQIKLTDGFFYERQKINAQTTLRYTHALAKREDLRR